MNKKHDIKLSEVAFWVYVLGLWALMGYMIIEQVTR
jgi:hypothetical protein